MAVQPVTTTTSTPIDLGTEDDLFVAPTGTLYGEGSLVTGTGSHRLSVQGSVAGLRNTPVAIDGNFVYAGVSQSGQVTTTSGSAMSFTLSDGLTLENAGTITSANVHGILAQNSDGSMNVSFSNSGTIAGFGAGVWLFTGAAEVRGVNSGVIRGGVTGGFLVDSAATGAVRFVNGGEIYATLGAAFGSGAGDDLLTNTGTLGGNVTLGGGGDSVTNEGVIAGNLDLGTGADSYRSVGGVVSGTVLGGAGNDTLRGGSAADALSGGDSRDTLRGGGDDDGLDGGGGADVIGGGRGDDTITGGLGSDTLTGGTGSDDFVYLAAAESPDGGAIDRIRDFESGSDRIDLSALGDLAFIGTAKLSGSGGEVRYKVGAGGHTTLLVDVDGDGSADMRVRLNNVDALDQDDFIL